MTVEADADGQSPTVWIVRRFVHQSYNASFTRATSDFNLFEFGAVSFGQDEEA